MVSLLDFINSVSETDDIQNVNARTVGRKMTFYCRGRGCPTAPTPLAMVLDQAAAWYIGCLDQCHNVLNGVHNPHE